MTNQKINGSALLPEKNTLRRPKFGTFLQSDPNILLIPDKKPYVNHYNPRHSNASNPSPDLSPDNSPSSSSSFFMSPINQDSPFTKSPWIFNDGDNNNLRQGLIGSLVREEGHIYSLASSGNLLYTGSDSKNVRVWKNLMEFSGFKSSSGLVKAIIVSGEKIYTGHQDGKIRVWIFSKKGYKRVNNLPTTKDYIKSSLNPRNYVEVRRHRNVPWIRHYDAVSCMSLDEERGLLYSGSWDKTMKVWRLSDSKCLESVSAHGDAVNSVVVGFDGLVFTGSADGSVKVWRREMVGKVTKHVLVDTLLKQENAVTAVTVSAAAAVVYAGTSDGLVNYWEREKRSLVHGGVVRGHKLAVLCLATAGSLLFSGSADKSICVWKREEGGIHTCLSVMTGHTGPVKCLAIVEEGHEKEDGDKGDQRWIVYSGSLDRSVKVWRLSENTPPPQVLRKVGDEIHAPPLTVYK